MFNIMLASTLQTHPSRVQIPISPDFLAQVNAGNVSAISSKGHDRGRTTSSRRPLARNMVGLSGASEIWPVTQQLVDEEVRYLIETAHGEVAQLMSANREKPDALAGRARARDA